MIVAVPSLIAAILFIDQLSKFLILKYLSFNKSYVIIKGILSISPAMNTGGGFGILPNQTLLFVSVSSLTIIFIIYLLLKKNTMRTQSLLLAMILAGAAGNLMDRLRFGAVVDFIDFHIWPVFNVADSCISIGVVILMWLILFKSKDEKIQNRQ